jgi:hypothetical protein
VKTFLRNNSLTLFFLALFVATLVGQSFAGQADFNHQLVADGLDPIRWTRYVTSSQFAVDVTENWQSEYLQFWLYLLGTVWLLQRGSPESKSLDNPGLESDQDQLVGRYAKEGSPGWAKVDGFRRTLYSHSLGIVMATIFFASWFAQSVAGRVAYNSEQLAQLEEPVSWIGYVTGADFWSRTLQNWQSEFLAVASMAALAIYLRERGSPQSKPVGAPHDATGIEG